MELDETVKDRRITKPQHVRQTLTEQVNMLRKIKPKNNKEAMDLARTITYVLNTSLTSMRDGELADRMKAVEDMMDKLFNEDEY